MTVRKVQKRMKSTLNSLFPRLDRTLILEHLPKYLCTSRKQKHLLCRRSRRWGGGGFLLRFRSDLFGHGTRRKGRTAILFFWGIMKPGGPVNVSRRLGTKGCAGRRTRTSSLFDLNKIDQVRMGERPELTYRE